MSERGERGPTGDHGQDGAVGPRGPVGPPGGTDPKYRRDIDRRLMVLYLVLIVILGLALGFFQYTTDKAEAARHDFEHKIVSNCQTNRQNTQTLNDFIDVLVKRVDASKDLSPAQKVEAKKLYARLRQTIPECPPGPR